MKSHLPVILSYEYMGPDAGVQEVPVPICPKLKTLRSLSPTRTPMSLPDITTRGPMFIGPMPGIFAMLFMFAPAPAEGLVFGIGIFMSIFGCGEACGFGVAGGICIPGIFISIF